MATRICDRSGEVVNSKDSLEMAEVMGGRQSDEWRDWPQLSHHCGGSVPIRRRGGDRGREGNRLGG